MRQPPTPSMLGLVRATAAEPGGAAFDESGTAAPYRNIGAAFGPADGCNELAARHYGQALDALALRGDDVVSLALTVPFCAAHCLCCARDVHAAQPAGVIDDYVDGLIAEMRTVAARGVGGRDVLQLHLGGGTVNELGDLELLRLMQAIRAWWRVPADAELSADYDPRRASRAQLQLLRNLGFRRIGFGVLDLDPVVQRAIGRLQSAALVEDACGVARACGVELVTLELMLGLPEQTGTGWRATLQRIVEIAPDRIVVSHYHHRPWHAPTQFAIDADVLPDAEALRALALQTADTLGAAGYRRIAPGHWVLDTDELAVQPGPPRRSVISPTVTPEAAVLGLGAGAVGRVGGSTFRNVSSLATWRQAVSAGAFPVAQVGLAGAARGAVGSKAEASWLS